MGGRARPSMGSELVCRGVEEEAEAGIVVVVVAMVCVGEGMCVVNLLMSGGEEAVGGKSTEWSGSILCKFREGGDEVPIITVGRPVVWRVDVMGCWWSCRRMVLGVSRLSTNLLEPALLESDSGREDRLVVSLGMCSI